MTNPAAGFKRPQAFSEGIANTISHAITAIPILVIGATQNVGVSAAIGTSVSIVGRDIHI